MKLVRCDLLERFMNIYLGLVELGKVGTDVEVDAFSGTGQRDSSYEQNRQQEVREQSGEVHNLHSKLS